VSKTYGVRWSLACATLLALVLLVLVCGCPKTGDTGSSTGVTAQPAKAGPAGTKADAGKPATGGKALRVVMIPKLKGIDFFNACEKGAQEAAKELGVDLTFDGPTESKVELQTQLVDTFVDKGCDVIAIAPNDPDAIAPCLKRAVEKGVTVIAWDTDATASTSGRAFFVNQCRAKDIGYTLVDEMAKQAGENAKFVIISGTPTASNQNTWMKYMDECVAEKHPGMQKLDVKFPGEDQAEATKATQDVLKARPDINGVFGITSISFPAATEAVVGAGKQKEIKVVGLATPNPMKKWVENGDIQSVVLWNPVDLGYLAIQVAKAAREGTLKSGATEFEAGRLGKVAVEGDQVILGMPLVFTKENIGQYDF
jgi:rhamnose transport system substrate-binding protein